MAKMAKIQLFTFLLFYLCYVCQFSSVNHKSHPANFLKPLNYSVKEFNVVTEDGYILKLFHVMSQSKHPRGPVVYLQHGLLASSMNFCVTGNKSLVATLMESNFDVWMGNNRGSYFSDKHIKPSVEKYTFWKFSWHQIGFYDIPAFINFVLEYTKQPNLHYIGHSQGTTVFFVMTSLRPEFNDKIKSMQALAPAVFMSNIPRLSIQLLARFLKILTFTWKALRLPEVISGRFLSSNRFLTHLCETNEKIKGTCISAVCKLYKVLQYIDNNSAPSSIYQFFHYLQQIKSGRFRNYDFGHIRNLMIYKRITPPSYNLKNVKVPVQVFASLYDSLVGIRDAKKLVDYLVNSENIIIVSQKNFGHTDFTWNEKARELVYEPALKSILKHEGK